MKDAEDINRKVKKIPANRVLRKQAVLETILQHVEDFAEVNSALARALLDTVRQIQPKVDVVSVASHVPWIHQANTDPPLDFGRRHVSEVTC